MKPLLIAPLVLLCGCQTIVSTPPADCLGFVPERWNEPIEGYPLPADDTLPAWQGFGVGQTGQLAKSNERTKDVLHIIRTCETKANAARPRRKILGIF